ncbi:MAG TPA: PEP-CTERM sorting domain-containing protein [Verrucomicrobiae bacterium]|nr:PEP-CTERM sorting domain-containing protein [Verrucomicrobiae bacterium]
MNSTIFAISLAALSAAQGQGLTASGTLAGTAGTGGLYNYTLTLTDTSSTTLGSLWYAWVPGSFFLPHAPSSVTTPSGWSDSIVSFNGSSIQFTANSPANELTLGQSVTFGFSSQDSPATLAGDFNGSPTGTSVAYSGNTLSGVSDTFVVASVPEPSTWILIGLGGIGCMTLRRKVLMAKPVRSCH